MPSNGFQRGLDEARANLASISPRPLTPRQFECLMGLDRARSALRSWADKHRVKTIALWTRGKGCESLLNLAREARMRVEAVYDLGNVAPETLWHRAAIRSFQHFNPSEVDGLLIGTLS